MHEAGNAVSGQRALRAAALVWAVVIGASAWAQTAPAKPAPARPAAKAPAEQGGGFNIEPIPAWVVPAVERPSAPVDPSPMHYRVIDDQIRVDAKSVWNYSRVVRVPNDAAGLTVASQIELDFDPTYQTLSLHQLDLIRDGKRLARLDRNRVKLLQRETQLERQMVDGRVTASIVLDDVRVGDQIEFAYSLRGANPVFEGKFAQTEWLATQRGPAALCHLRLLAPPERAIQQRVGPPNVRVETRMLGGMRETLLRREAVPQLRADVNAPASAFVEHLVQFSEFADWGDVARWGRGLFAPKSESARIDEKAAEIRASTPDRASQVLAALKFAQQDVRYFGTEAGMGSHRPALPDKVIEQRFGDCKDKVGLLVALLRRLGVPASPVLVSTSWRRHVDAMIPGPLAFDHVIARVDLDGKLYWLDATRAQQRGPLAARQAMGFSRGLVLDDGQTALAALPTPFDEQRVAVTDAIHVQRFADAPTLESRVTYRGDLADAFRDAAAARSAQEMATELARVYLKIYPRARATAPLQIEDATDDNAITFVQRFELVDFWRFPELRFLQADIVFWAVADALQFPKSETRRDPYGFGAPGLYRHTVTLDLPDDVMSQASTQRFEDGDARVQLKTIIEGAPRRVEYLAEARFGVDQVDAPDWPAYTAKVGKLMPRLGLTVGISAIPLSAMDAFNRDMKTLDESIRSRRTKVVTATQAQALFKSGTLSAQLAGGRLAPALEAQALTERGVQYDHLGKFEQAKQDFARAMTLAGDVTETQNAAAVNALELSELDRSIALTNAVLQRAPNDTEALNTRALARYFKKDLADARADFEALLKDRSAVRRGYPMVWLSMALRQSGQATDAMLAAYPKEQWPTDWPRPLIDMALGGGSPEAAIEAAKAGKRPLEALCEAYFYIAEKHFVEGDVKRANEFWRKAIDLGVVEFIEDGASRLRLAGMGMR